MKLVLVLSFGLILGVGTQAQARVQQPDAPVLRACAPQPPAPDPASTRGRPNPQPDQNARASRADIAGLFAGDGSCALFNSITSVIGAAHDRNEIARSLTFDNAAGISSGKGFAVAEFTHQINRAGAAAGYTRNDLTDTYGQVPSTTYELNHNNFGPDSGDDADQNSLYGRYPWKTQMNLLTAGTGRLLAGIVIDAVPGHAQLYNRGLLITGDSIRLNAFEDASNARTSIMVSGRHSVGLDMRSATVETAIALPNSAPLTWALASGRTTGFEVDATGTLRVGQGSQGIALGQSVRPGADLAFDLGAEAARWNAVHLIRTYYGVAPDVFDSAGRGSPEGVVVASVGSTFRRIDGGPGSVFYVKESGEGSTGWAAK